MSEWVIVVHRQKKRKKKEKKKKKQFSSFITMRTSYNLWGDDLHFVLGKLSFFRASSLKQQYASRHVAPRGHINPIPS